MFDFDSWNPFKGLMRFASGSHQAGSGKGCVMNIISWENGDVEITDYPACSARPLARMMQILNDTLAGRDGYLSAEDAIKVLYVGNLTKGTGDHTVEHVHAWLAAILSDPEMGVHRFATTESSQAKLSEALLALGAPIPEYPTSLDLTIKPVDRYEHTLWCVRKFREIMGLDAEVAVDSDSLHEAYDKMTTVSAR